MSRPANRASSAHRPASQSASIEIEADSPVLDPQTRRGLPASWLRIRYVGAALILLVVPLLASADQMIVLDISTASASDVTAAKQQLESDAYWLELGEQLVLVGSRQTLERAAGALPLLSRRDAVDRRRLVLRAQGCSHHPEGHDATVHGLLLARGSRWELRELGELETLSEGELGSGAWRAVEPDSTLSRQYRLDVDGAAPPVPSVQLIVNAVSPTRWFADVGSLASWDRSSYATTSLNQARDFIASRFTDLGLDVSTPTFTMNSPGGNIVRNNVLGRWTGTEFPDQWIIVGAHYDSRNSSITSTVNAPGAEDNASGCAGVIEMARVLLPSRPGRSILFMCYAGEEQGLLGSAAHVQALNQSGDLSKLRGVAIMDMIGYSASSTLRALFESSSAHTGYLQQFAAAAATYVPELSVLLSTNPFGSDHVPYLNAGVPTVLSIENDWSIYPHYHRTTDTPANMGAQSLAMGGAILRANAALLASITGAGTLAFSDGFEASP